MEMKQFIEGPALVAALKARVETLTKANRKLTDENMQLKSKLTFLLPSRIEDDIAEQDVHWNPKGENNKI